MLKAKGDPAIATTLAAQTVLRLRYRIGQHLPLDKKLSNQGHGDRPFGEVPATFHYKDPFLVTKEPIYLTAPAGASAVVFAAGRGGDPERHLPLLETLHREGCSVLAPHFRMLPSPVPTAQDMEDRLNRICEAIDRHLPTPQSLVGIGHSIGATTLLALSGARGYTKDGTAFGGRSLPFSRLALLAPPTGFFRAPHALRRVCIPLQIRIGDADTITPMENATMIKDALAGQASVDCRCDSGADHFTYMDSPPPGAVDAHPDHAAFLRELASDLRTFARG
ncbi:alpha/beta hydrolase [Rhodobacteraceae bacterium R_SAG3]|nr:alpha/beta hydrolase [Rhodobacteraceae bacterium R_SAG3]